MARAQEGKHGFGEQGDLASGLDRKKEEQGELKRELGIGQGGEPTHGGGVDVQGVLGGKGDGEGGFVGAKGEEGREGEGGGRQGDHSHV